MGNPLTSKLLLDAFDKDLANATVPSSDAARIGAFLAPGIVLRLAGVLGMSIPGTNRTDLVATFLKYPGHDPNVCTEASPCADILHLDLGVPPTDPQMQSRLGVLGGDPAGFPNGRRVFDDVTDITLRSFALVPSRVGDGVNANDVAFSDTFPYLATPHQSRDHVHGPCPSPDTPTSTPSPAPTPEPTPVATATPPPAATPTAAPTSTPSPTSTPAPTPTPSPAPSATPAPTGGAFVCTGVHAIPDPDDPTSGHVFDGGECSHTMAELRFVITSGSTYTSFTVPMPSGGFSSTNQPNDTIIGTNPSPAVDKRTIAGAKFTTAAPNPHTIVVRALSFTGQTSQHTVTVPAP
jgi:cell division septation protein DedD